MGGMRYLWPTVAVVAIVAALFLTQESSARLVGGIALSIGAYLAGLFADAAIQHRGGRN